MTSEDRSKAEVQVGGMGGTAFLQGPQSPISAFLSLLGDILFPTAPAPFPPRISKSPGAQCLLPIALF